MGNEFIEHFGVKGMRWGVRSNKTNSNPKQPKNQKTTREQTLHDRRVSVGKTMAAAYVAGVAGGYALKELAKKSFS